MKTLTRNFFGEHAKLDHVGMVVESIKSVSPDSEMVEDPTQKARVCFVSLNGVTVELIEPLGADSPVASSLEKGIKIAHLCYEVPDISVAIEEARRNKFFCLARPVPAVAFEGRKIAWVYSREFGLFELLECPAV